MPSAIVLAGGQSRRLGRDKASTIVAGKTLLQHVIDRVSPLVDEVIVVTRPGQILPPVTEGSMYAGDVKLVLAEDVFPGKGPLGGLYSGLAAASVFPAVVVACDMPLLQPALIEELLRLAPGFDAVVPVHLGRPEPLCAVYATSCLDAIQARIDRADLKLSALPDDLHTCYVAEADWRRLDPDGLSFFNLNTPDDLARAEALLG